MKSVLPTLLLVICSVEVSLSVNCNYLHLNLDMGYACELIDVVYNKGEDFPIEGQHSEGLGDSDVLSVFASTSNISHVPRELLQKFDKLERLLMSQVSMLDIEGALEICQVNTITFYKNELTKIYPRGFENCTNLEYLDLGSNRIEEIPKEAFEGIGKLQNLVIDNNPIKAIDPAAFETLTNLRALYSLYIEVPEILPQFFSSLKKIERIYFSSTLPRSRARLATGTFKSLPELKYIYVKGNNGDEMEIEAAAFEDLNLFSLDLSGNSIRRLNSNSFKGLSNLTWLYLQDNQILQIERTFFANFPRLERLNAKGNLCINQSYISDGDPFGNELYDDFQGCFANWDAQTSSSTVSSTLVYPVTAGQTTTQGTPTVLPSILRIASFYCICSFLQRINLI